jgi:hypothetical protein
MGHKGPVQRPRHIWPRRVRTQIPFIQFNSINLIGITHSCTSTLKNKQHHPKNNKNTYRQQDNTGVPQKHEKSKSFNRRNQKEDHCVGERKLEH